MELVTVNKSPIQDYVQLDVLNLVMKWLLGSNLSQYGPVLGVSW